MGILHHGDVWGSITLLAALTLEAGTPLSPPPLAQPAPKQPDTTALGPSQPPDNSDVDIMQAPAPDQPVLMNPKDDTWRRDHLRVLPPRAEGTGFWIAGFAAIGGVFIKQMVFVLTCGDPGCQSGRLADRLLWLGGTAALTYASALRSHHVAYNDALAQTLRPRKRKHEIWGGVLLGVGAAAFLTDVGLQSACMLGGGPYFIDEKTPDPNSRFYYGCRGWWGTGVMNLGAAAIVTGASMLAWERSYQRDRDIYRRGRLRVVPVLGGIRASAQF